MSVGNSLEVDLFSFEKTQGAELPGVVVFAAASTYLEERKELQLPWRRAGTAPRTLPPAGAPRPNGRGPTRATGIHKAIPEAERVVVAVAADPENETRGSVWGL